jgi:hypothetical protein
MRSRLKAFWEIDAALKKATIFPRCASYPVLTTFFRRLPLAPHCFPGMRGLPAIKLRIVKSFAMIIQDISCQSSRPPVIITMKYNKG